MASGVAVSDECISKFNELKLGHSYRYIIFKLNDSNTEIVVEKTAPPTATWEEFVKELPASDCRYAAYDFEFSVEGGQREKILFVLWSSDQAKTKSKMLYTSSKDAIKKKLNLMSNDIQATDAAEIDYNVVLEKVKTFTK
eukprot:TRINITY_DN18071_c0_g1_i1.p2 TRINITY_DN18071_c0_g1~~TRINITY_DN18071_c0_g1_i1.p2  ORF type:complete len:140 (-),score=37.73 TRINITY_DN18071_c0_g1_i1:115-534(-)